MKKLFSLTVAAFVVLTVACTPVIAQQATAPAASPSTIVDFDPNVLIGTYDGKWKYKHFSDSAELKITKVLSGGRLEGAIYYMGRGGATTNRWWQFTDGHLEGMTLVFSASSGGSFSLAITNGTTLELKGLSTGLAMNAEFEFQKKNRK